MIWLKCEKSCPEKNRFACREDGSRAFEVESESEDEDGRFFIAHCANCGEIDFVDEETWVDACEAMDRRARRMGRANLTKYPYVEPHSGEVCHSASDRDRIAKAYGFHAAEHGIDGRFNDELADKLKDRERNKKDRLKNARKSIREAVRASRVD